MKPIIVDLYNCHLKTPQDSLYQFIKEYYQSLLRNEDQRWLFGLDHHNFIPEFRTIRFSGARRSGHTTTIIKMVEEFDKSLIFTPNMRMSKIISEIIMSTPQRRLLRETDRLGIQTQGSQIGLDLIKSWKPKAIFADAWGCYRDGNKAAITEAILQTYPSLPFEEQPFIFLFG